MKFKEDRPMKAKAILITALLCAFAGTAHAQWDGNGTSAQGIAIWTALQAAFDAASTDANNPTTITLAGNVTASESDSYLLLSGGRHVVLDLNGHTLSRGLTAATTNGYVIGMANGSLTIRDSGTGGTITGGYNTGNIGCIAVSTNATLTLESGTISGNRITNQGGSAINCSGTVYMTGGTITGNTANTGRDGYEASDLNMCGAIYFSGSSGAALYMSGGAITGNRCGRTTAGAAGITSHLGIGSASVHLSGNYNISGNEQGTYNRATGEWTDLTPSDIHNSPRLAIRIDGPVSPAAPARLILNGSTGGHRETFTSGWATHMGSADPEDYFTLDPASGLGIGIVGGEAHIGTLHAITLADGLTASVTSAAQGKSVTLGGAAAPGTIGGITYATDYIVSYNDGTTDHADRYAADALGNATFLMPDADVTVSSETVGTAVAYIDEDGNEQNCTDFTVVSSSYAFGDYYGTATLGVDDNVERWYAVVGTVSLDKPLMVNGNARLILCDGAALNINADIKFGTAFGGSNHGLTIYGQARQTGTLSVTNTGGAIYVNTFTVNGGTVIATGGTDREGILISGNSYGILTINRGSVTATGAFGVNLNNQGTLTQNGGTLSATGSGIYRAGINNVNATLNILGGTFSATGTDGAYGIYADASDIYATTVTLGWTNPDDRITASSIYLDGDATLQVRDGQTLYADDVPYSGDITASAGDLAGKTLAPYQGAGSGTSAVTARKASFAGVERYWTTFYSATRYALPAGAQAFIMKSDHVLYRIGDGSVIPAGCAVVIMADASALTNRTATGGIVTLTPTSAAEPSVSGNILLGVDSPTAAPSGAYVMSKVGSDFGFFTFTGTIPANKAYYVE